MFANINGVKIFFDIDGLQWVPDGPVMKERPVCFVLHGGPGDEHSYFLPEMAELAKYMQIIFMDDRNCGLSERGDLTLSSVEQDVKDIEALRQYLGLGKVFVVGHSYGGMKAQEYLINYPDSIFGAAIISSTARPAAILEKPNPVLQERGTPEQLNADLAKLGYKGYLTLLDNIYHYKCNTPEEKKAVDDSIERAIPNLEVNGQHWATDLMTMDFREGLKNVKCPVAIICGKEDHLISPEHSELLHELIPGSELNVLDECGHMSTADRADFIIPYLNDFVWKCFEQNK